MEYEDNWKPEVQFGAYWNFLVLTALQIEDTVLLKCNVTLTSE